MAANINLEQVKKKKKTKQELAPLNAKLEELAYQLTEGSRLNGIVSIRQLR